MERQFAEWIFDSLMGSLTEDCRCKAAEDLFAAGKPCEVLYGQMLDAYWRLCERLGEAEDDDGEIIINALLDITRIVGLKMFEYGQKYSNR